MSVVLSLAACSSVSNTVSGIVPQLPYTSSANNFVPASGQDIIQANELLAVGKKREAADAYFKAGPNYSSPERERLILQAAELASVLKDDNLTQQYLAPLNFGSLSLEHQTRFRLVQAQLALNDRNYREALRILPQRIDNLPAGLGEKVLSTRMSAAQASGDKLSLIQELVLQETSLKESYKVSLNHNRIWGHAKQIPAFQLEEAKTNISHPIVKNWLSLAQLSRIESNGPISKKKTLRNDLGSWIQSNPNHPGMTRALGLLNASPTTTVTPYSVDAPKPVITSSVARTPVINTSVARNPAITSSVIRTPVITSSVVRTPVNPQALAPQTVPQTTSPQFTPPATTPEVKGSSNVNSLYENIKIQIQ